MANKTLTLLFISVFFLCFQSANSHAVCQYDALEGHWVATKYHRLEPKRIEIKKSCIRNIRNQSYSYQEIWTIRAFNYCQPKDCIWGRVKGRKDSSGNIIAKFETFSATRYIKVIPNNSNIELKYKIDYRSLNRKDLIGSIKMRRVK